MPSAPEVLIFAGGPAALLVVCAKHYASRAARVLAWIQLAAVVGFAGWLLWVQFRSIQTTTIYSHLVSVQQRDELARYLQEG